MKNNNRMKVNRKILVYVRNYIFIKKKFLRL